MFSPLLLAKLMLLIGSTLKKKKKVPATAPFLPSFLYLSYEVTLSVKMQRNGILNSLITYPYLLQLLGSEH